MGATCVGACSCSVRLIMSSVACLELGRSQKGVSISMLCFRIDVMKCNSHYWTLTGFKERRKPDLQCRHSVGTVPIHVGICAKYLITVHSLKGEVGGRATTSVQLCTIDSTGSLKTLTLESSQLALVTLRSVMITSRLAGNVRNMHVARISPPSQLFPILDPFSFPRCWPKQAWSRLKGCINMIKLQQVRG